MQSYAQGMQMSTSYPLPGSSAAFGFDQHLKGLLSLAWMETRCSACQTQSTSGQSFAKSSWGSVPTKPVSMYRIPRVRQGPPASCLPLSLHGAPGPAEMNICTLGCSRTGTACCCGNMGRLSRGKGEDIPGEGNTGELVKGVKVGSAPGKASEAFKVCSVSRSEASP